MSLVVTGANGHLGHLVVESLLSSGVPAGDIVAGARRPETLDGFAAAGVDVRRLDYDDPASLATGLAGAERVLIVSGTDFGHRVEQHTAVARAALDAGARHLLYTSAPRASTTSMLLAAEHAATEAALEALGAPLTLLRNGWYFENYTTQLPTYLEHGVVGAAGDGRVSGADRADYAEAAAVVLTGEGHEGQVYELGGDTSFSLTELALVVSAATGRHVAHHTVSQAELAGILGGAGVPEPVAGVLADVDRAIAAGELHVTSGDLSRLIGRPTGTLTAAVERAVAALAAA
jgi:NAD(P)H dehydrogenase (quinone)